MTDRQISLERSLYAAKRTLQNALEDGVDSETVAILAETVNRFEALAAKRGVPRPYGEPTFANCKTPFVERDEAYRAKRAGPVVLRPTYASETRDRIY